MSVPDKLGCIIPPAPFRLDQVLESAGISQRQVAKRLGIDEGHVSKLARGLIVPKWATAVALSRVLGVPLERFLGDQPAPLQRRRAKAT